MLSAVVVAVSLAGCDKNTSESLDESTETEKAYLSTDIAVDEPIDDTEMLGAMDSGVLEESEISALAHMRKEELLARDVYRALFDLYNYPIFNNISRSEEWHANIVLFMLEKYDLEDPAAGHEEGVFEDPAFQNLYDSLLTVGQQSGTDALLVGAAIEDLDIYDLQSAIETEVDNPDIVCAFENLMKGSRNHLRAFTRVLSFGSATYEAQYISSEAYETIINSEFEVGPADCGCPMQEELAEADTLALAEARVDEMVATDVMLQFYQNYNYQIFETMRNIEHWQANLLTLKINYYDLQDPLGSEHTPGVFEDENAQVLYNTLIEEGSADGMAAVKVALKIQESSIFGYNNLMMNIESDHLYCSFLNLNRVSRNNIRTLYGVLQESWNEEYTPEYISQEYFDEIINTEYEIGPTDCDEEG